MIRRNRVLATVVALSISPAVVALAQDAPQKVQRAAEKLFPEGNPTIQERREINGVKTYEATVERSGEARQSAVITENGDILRSSQRRTDGAPTPSVERIADQLFNMPMDDYQAVTQTYYLLDTNVDNRDYQLQLDATGRIRDADTQRNLRLEDVSSMEKATGGDRDAVEGFVKKWNDGATINEVYQYAPISGYYLVDFKSEDGDQSQIVLNRQGRVYQEIAGIKEDALPKGVRNSMEQVLGDASIQSASRATLHYYEFEKPVGDDTLVLKIRPNGDVLQVISERAQEEERAVTAGERQGRGNRDDRDRDDRGDEGDRQND